MPLSANKARVEITVSGPVGRIDIKGVKKGQIVNLRTIMDPVGMLSILTLMIPTSSKSQTKYRMTLRPERAGDPARPELTKTEPDGEK